MRVSMDRAGRVVVPKTLRTALGIAGACELQLTAKDDYLELRRADAGARIGTRGKMAVITLDDGETPRAKTARKQP